MAETSHFHVRQMPLRTTSENSALDYVDGTTSWKEKETPQEACGVLGICMRRKRPSSLGEAACPLSPEVKHLCPVIQQDEVTDLAECE